jgi:CSLREA domain-containing protein
MIKAYLFVVSFCAVLFFAGAVYGATFTVTKAADTNDGVCDADCSLREAVAAANAAGGTVVFSATLVGVPIVLTGGEIQMNGIAVKGFGADKLTISGGNNSRIFNTSGNSAISGVTLTGGNGIGAGGHSGGAILSSGNLNLEGVHVTGNSVTGSGLDGGGVLFAGGSANFIRNSTFTNNTASDQGGGILVGASTNIYNSTFTGNSAADGGAISVIGVSVLARNATISDNTAKGVYCAGLGGFTFGNSIVQAIYRAFDLSDAHSQGNNIATSASGSKPVSYLSSDLIGTDPMLGALQMNGGPTPTFALQPGSPAIDAGSNTLAVEAGLGTDQRRYTRFVDGNGDMNAVVDIGAYEYNGVPVTPIMFAGRVATSTGNGVGRAVVTITDSEGVSQSITTSPLGYFSFQNVYVGNISVKMSSKSHRFTPTVIFATENVTNVELVVQ